MDHLASLAPFMGLGRGASKRRASEEDPKAEGDEDEKAKARKAEGDEDPKAEDTEDPKAKAAEGDEDPEAEDDEDADPAMEGKAARAARLKERNRIAAILAHPQAAANPGIAMNLAFKTGLTVAAAHAVLAGGDSKPKAAGLHARMAGLEHVRPGPGGPSDRGGPAAIQAGWTAAYDSLKSAARR